MNFDMNVFMNALQAGFGAGNTAKIQAPAEQKEENLFEDVKPAAKNQTQQPQIAQDQQTMGFFAMMGMMFFGMMSFFGFGNNANNNVNNNTNAGNAAADKLVKDNNMQADVKKHVAYAKKHVAADDVKKAEAAYQPVKKQVDKEFEDWKKRSFGFATDEERDAAYQKSIEGFTPTESKVVRYLTIEEVGTVRFGQTAGYDPNSTEKGNGEALKDLKLAYRPGWVYYEGTDGKIHSEWADQQSKLLNEIANEAGKALTTYIIQHPNANYDNDPKFKALHDAWSLALNTEGKYNRATYGTTLF